MSTVDFAVGVDLGSSNTVLSVYDVSKKAALPLELVDDKSMPTVVALTENGAIVGKRAEVRSAKRCQDVLCAYRQMLYGMEESWQSHRKGCEERWQFSMAQAEAGERGDNFLLRGERVPVARLIEEVMRVVCSQLIEASKPGGTLQLDASQNVAWVSVAIGVPECFSDEQRSVVNAAASAVVSELLGKSTQVKLVCETLAAALQFVSLPPFQARTFMVVDFGASHLSASLYSFVGGDDGMTLQEVTSSTNVFVGGDEMVHRLMLWCERRKPFQDSMLTSKTAIFKLRKELRSAIKTLTVAEEALVEVDSVVAGHDLALMLTMEDFERECKDIFEAVGDAFALVLEAGQGLVPSEVVLVGGASRVPKIQANLQRIVALLGNSAQVKKTVDLDRGIAMGLASIAALGSLGVGALRVPLQPQEPFREMQQRIRLPEGMCKPRGGGGKGGGGGTGCAADASAGGHEGERDGDGGADSAALALEMKQLRAENALLIQRAETAEAKVREVEERQDAAGSGGDGVEKPALPAASSSGGAEIEQIRLQLEESRGVIAELREQLSAAVSRAEAAEHKVVKRDKALRRAEGDMRAVEEERDALLLRAKIAEGSPALPPPVAGSWSGRPSFLHVPVSDGGKQTACGEEVYSKKQQRPPKDKAWRGNCGGDGSGGRGGGSGAKDASSSRPRNGASGRGEREGGESEGGMAGGAGGDGRDLGTGAGDVPDKQAGQIGGEGRNRPNGRRKGGDKG